MRGEATQPSRQSSQQKLSMFLPMTPHIKSPQHRKSLPWKPETLIAVGYVSHTSEKRTGVASRPEWKITAAAIVHPLQLYTTFLLPLLICLFVLLLLFLSLSLACVSIFHTPPNPPLAFWMETLSRARKMKHCHSDCIWPRRFHMLVVIVRDA